MEGKIIIKEKYFIGMMQIGINKVESYRRTGLFQLLQTRERK